MAEIIEKAHVSKESFQEHRFVYRDDPHSGFTFPVKDGEIDLGSMTEAAKENLQFCLSRPEEIIDEGVTTRTYSIPIPTRLRCNCGEEFYLENGYYGAYQCPECGQWYNDFGQELEPPEQWEEPIDED